MRKIKDTRIWKQKYKLLGILLFAFILSRISFSELWQSISNTDPVIYFFSFLLSFPALYLRALRWRMFATTTIKLPLSGFEAFKYYWIAVFWGAITPGKIGEMLKIKYLKDLGVNWGASAAATIVDRLIDLVCLMLLFYFGVLFLSNEMIGNFSTIPYLIAAAAAVVLMYWKRQWIYALFLGFIRKIFKKVRAGSIEEHLKSFAGAVRAISAKVWLVSSAITLVTWIIYSVQLYLIAVALGMHISIVDFSLIMYIVAFITLVPVSVEGIGTRDAVLIYLLGHYAVLPSGAIALSMLILGLMLFNTLVGAGFYFFRKKVETPGE